MNAAEAVVRNVRRFKRWAFDRYYSWESYIWHPGGMSDVEAEFWPLHAACKPFSMTSPEQLYALHTAVKYVVQNDIPGDFVECGVWRGGSVMMMALTLQKLNKRRKIHCFDTFEGMPPPTEADIRHETGEQASTLLRKSDKGTNIWAIAQLDEVQENVRSTSYPFDLVNFHAGRVEHTLPHNAPARIAILRLDTDWYESTKHELIHLYPLLVPGGVLIIDDYGTWEGSRKATEEYLDELDAKLMLVRVDRARIGVKSM